MKLSSKIKQILSEGFCLQKYGINNWALTENQALLAIEKIKELNIAILGGDACFRSNGIFQLNYDNWYVEKKLSESKKDYSYRSATETIQYIKEYKNHKYDEVFFILVLEN